MNGPAELHVCGRCGRSGRDLDVRLWWANVAREAVIDRRPHHGPMLALEYRCATCREAARRPEVKS